jgi:hypothetical protein
MSERPAKLGRPPLYTQEQVRASIAELLQKGLTPTVEAVKEVLCLRFGVPRTIRTEPLAREIAALLEADERQREEDLLACLAPGTVNAVHEKCSALERTALLAIAEEWTRLAEKDRQRQSAAAQERAMLVGRYADLEEDLKERDAQIEALEAKVATEKARGDALEAERDRLARDLAELRAAGDARSTIMDDLARLLGAHTGDARPDTSPDR